MKELLKPEVNLGKTERIHSAMGGLLLITSVAKNIKEEKPLLSAAKSLLGAYLFYRGVSGYCPVGKIFAKK
jgi:hypothetical protein